MQDFSKGEGDASAAAGDQSAAHTVNFSWSDTVAPVVPRRAVNETVDDNSSGMKHEIFQCIRYRLSSLSTKSDRGGSQRSSLASASSAPPSSSEASASVSVGFTNGSASASAALGARAV